MAVDEAILRSVAAGRSPATLRLYGWAPRCLSLGRGQPSTDVSRGDCVSGSVGWVRRPTGGRAILHGCDLTYSICLALDDPRATGGITQSYRRLSEGLAEGLRLLGVPVERPIALAAGGEASPACFEALAGHEIAFQGRKLLGSAQFRSGGGLLQHGSLPLYGDVADVVGFLACPDEERERMRWRLKRSAVTLEVAAGRRVSFGEAADALRRGMEQALDVCFEAGGLTALEAEMAAALARAKYSDLNWGRRRREAAERAVER